MAATRRTGTKVETNCEREAEFCLLLVEEPVWSTNQREVEEYCRMLVMCN